LLYALFQAYDSVAVEADIEIGGTDQKFNLLFGRQLQREFKQSPQVIITLPLLEGLDGVKKMSKSYNNYVGITEPPNEIFGKLMSIPDSSIPNYLRLTTSFEEEEIQEMEKKMKDESINPMKVKLQIAHNVVSLYHSSYAASCAEKEFLQVFSKKEIPKEVPVFEVKREKIWLVKLLVDSGLAPTRSEARRLIKYGGVKIDSKVIRDIDFEFEPQEGTILKVGKRRFLKITLRRENER
jgi:tyrosyl-tRNA synthetase